MSGDGYRTHNFTKWRKSCRSGQGDSNCVEVALAVSDALIGVRDSKDPSGPVLLATTGGWSGLLDAIRDGRLGRR